MSVDQNRFQQKSLYDQPFSNISTLLKCFQSSSNIENTQKQFLSFCRINRFLFALLKAKEAIISTGITRNLSCHPSYSEALKFIEELDGVQVKNSILMVLCNYIEVLKENTNKLKYTILRSQQNLSREWQFNKEQLGQLTNLFLSKLMQMMKINLKSGFLKKQIYGLIHFKWTSQFVRAFILHLDYHHQNLFSLEKQISKLEALLTEKISSQQKILKNLTQNAIQYEKMPTEQLFKYVQNKDVAHLLQSQFKSITERLKNQQLECESYKKKLAQSQQIIKSQIDLLNKQQTQKKYLNDSLLWSQEELQNLNEKCQLLQQGMKEIDYQLSILKMKDTYQQGYYMNPLWQKQQLQQKYYIEIIQLESDLLLQKDQVKSLVNIILQQIKLSHEIFHDIRASKFMIYRFDRQAAKLLKSVSAFDKINLEQHLIVRQEGLESESSPQMYKSTISTFSEVDTEYKRSERQILLFQSIQQEYKQQ